MNLIALVASAVLWLLVAVPPLVGVAVLGPPLLWWALWVLGGAVFAGVQIPAIGLRPVRVLTWVLAGCALALFLISPDSGFGPLPLTAAATVMAWVLPVRRAFQAIAVLIVAMTLTGVARSYQLVDFLGLFLYAAWMVFACLLVDGQRRVDRANCELQQVNAELGKAQARLAESSRAEERLRISRDLHDLVGHQLTALAVNLEVASHLADGAAAEPVARSRAIAKDLLRDVRAVVGRLREPDVTIDQALRAMADAVPRPVIHLQIEGALPSDAEQCEVLLRCVQEVITNAVRHADADNLWVRISRSAGQMVLTARDDGRGVQELRPGNGLVGMRERVERAGGVLAFDAAGAGFGVEARLPAAA